mmetsp:Transcript_25394/g.57578  ORF Transcript_25394/g.57578 Transcript_25394/m.57578 type:complete len:347 (-) Transcript_25394:62-1102(-)
MELEEQQLQERQQLRHSQLQQDGEQRLQQLQEAQHSATAGWYVPEGLTLLPMAAGSASASSWQGAAPQHHGGTALSPLAPAWNPPSTSHSSSTNEAEMPAAPQANVASPKFSAKEADATVAQLKASGGDAERLRALIEPFFGKVWAMALTRHGCRVAQAALEAAAGPERVRLAEELKGKVWEAVRSPHANHVLQRIVTVLPPGQVDFVLLELLGRAREAARHPFGCRVLERLLEHCHIVQTAGLVAEISEDVVELSRHPYGNYVVQHVLEHGAPEQKSRIALVLRPEARRLARHKVASHVVECALLHCDQEAKNLLKDAMAGDPEELASLTHSNYGSFVVKEMRKR